MKKVKIWKLVDENGREFFGFKHFGVRNGNISEITEMEEISDFTLSELLQSKAGEWMEETADLGNCYPMKAISSMVGLREEVFYDLVNHSPENESLLVSMKFVGFQRIIHSILLACAFGKRELPVVRRAETSSGEKVCDYTFEEEVFENSLFYLLGMEWNEVEEIGLELFTSPVDFGKIGEGFLKLARE